MVQKVVDHERARQELRRQEEAWEDYVELFKFY